MTRVRFALLAAVSTVVLGLSASAGAARTTAGTGTVTSGTAGAGTAACLAHVIGGLSADDSDWYDYYTAGCTGHDEPELDPVSSAPRSAQNITWRVALPADGTFPVSSVGPTFWFGGTVKDSNPDKLGERGFPGAAVLSRLVHQAVHARTGASTSCTRPTSTRRARPSGRSQQQGQQITEPAAFNGMLTDASGKDPFVMHAHDVVDVHIWAPSPRPPTGSRSRTRRAGQTSSVLVLISPKDGPLTPEFTTNEIGNALDWGGVWDTPMAFVWEIGHSDLYGDHPGQFCVPGQTFCGSFNPDNWAGFQPIRIFDATFGDGSHPQNWAVVSDTGGKAEVLGNSFVGPTDCTTYGGPYCIYPWFSWDGGGVQLRRELSQHGRQPRQANQFAQTAKCPEDGVFPGPTYCDHIVK